MRGHSLQLHSACKLRLYFWRVSPGNQSARAAVKQSCYRAFTQSKLGGVTRKVMQELSRIQATTRAINEHASYKARQDISGTLFMREQQSALLTGKGTEEHLSLIHSWLGHLLYVAVQRIKRLARGECCLPGAAPEHPAADLPGAPRSGERVAALRGHPAHRVQRPGAVGLSHRVRRGRAVRGAHIAGRNARSVRLRQRYVQAQGLQDH